MTETPTALRLIPRHDKIVIEQYKPGEKTAGGILLPAEAREGLPYGKVIAVGPGAPLSDGSRRPIELQPGDEVAFSKYAGESVEIENRTFLVMREDEIQAVISRKESDGGQG